MKTLRRSLLLSSLALLGAASLACASVPTMDVTVSDSSGKLFFKGKTNSNGLFTTKTLPAGDYIVQFNSKSATGGPFALVVAAGKKKTSADSVQASQFVKGGVAMRVQVDKPINLEGQVAPVGQLTMNNDQQSTKGNGKVKYINGKKYVWVEGELGSNIGGHWVEAGSQEARNHVQNLGTKGLQDMQSKSQYTSGGGGG